MDGWIKIYRKITDWEWYKDVSTLHLFIHLLITANREDKSWRGIVVGRGQRLTSRSALASDTGLSEGQVKRSLNKLIATNNLTIKATNKYTLITICNYESYQDSSNDSDQQNDQPRDQQAAPKQEEEKNIYPPSLSKERVSPLTGGTPIEERQRRFYDSLIPFVSQYGKEMIRDFYDYWSEPDRAAKPKMRWEKEKTWGLERRLGRWRRNNEERAGKQAPKSKGERMWDNVKKNLAVLPFNEDGTINI